MAGREDVSTPMARASDVFVKTINGESPGMLDYSEASLARLDAFIEEAWPPGSMTEDTTGYTVPLLAAYVGEVVRRNVGGRWLMDETVGGPILEHGGMRVSPYNRAGKRMTEGSDWSLAIFSAELRAVWVEGATPSPRGWRPFKRR